MNTKTQRTPAILPSSAYTHAFAVPGDPYLIDLVDPRDGRSQIYGKTLDEIRANSPTAEIITVESWIERRAAAQDTPITWTPTTAERYHEMLNVLPPAAWQGWAFLVGEPTDHHAKTGRARFACYVQKGDAFMVSSRPITRTEFAALFAGGAR